MSKLKAQVSDAFLASVDGAIRGDMAAPPVAMTGNVSIGSPTMTPAIPPVDPGIKVGMAVAGTDVPPGTVVVAIDPGGANLTMSQNATATHGPDTYAFGQAELFFGLKMGLFTNNPSLSNNTVLSDLTQAGYPGYALAALTVKPVRKDANGNYIEDYGSAHFQPTSTDPTPLAVLGYFVQASVGGADALLYTEFFDSPVNLVLATDAVDVSFDGMVSNAFVWGGLCALC